MAVKQIKKLTSRVIRNFYTFQNTAMYLKLPGFFIYSGGYRKCDGLNMMETLYMMQKLKN